MIAGQHPLVPIAGSQDISAIHLRGVTAQYPASSAPALSDANLTVPVGSLVALVGANGAGKSTLLKAIVGLVPLQAGEILVHGQPFSSQRRRVAYLPQIGELDWHFPVSLHRLVVTGRYVHLGWLRRPGRRDAEMASAALARLGLDDLMGRQIGQLSGGQRQRALLARAMVQQADVLLLDEPFTAVDAESRSVLIEVLRELRRQEVTVLVATHDLESLSVDPTAVVHLRDGRIDGLGGPPYDADPGPVLEPWIA
ncbi:MAG: putative transporter ATP-binding protein [Chloroflexi bacterium]|nr:putative transporter ATP-binding protein [Chloroflexota bacterium]